MRSYTTAIFTAAVLRAAAFHAEASACPAFIEGRQLGAATVGARHNLRLFTLEMVQGQRHWESQPLQIDPMETGPGGLSVLAVPESGADPDKEPLGPEDRLALRVDSFGMVRSAQDLAPCHTSGLYELQNPSAPERFAYLASCDDISDTASEHPPVTLHAEQLAITSPLFHYTYLASNQLLFSHLGVRDPRSGTVFDAGQDADILLHLDVKNFFTMNLTNANVQSFVEHTRTGSLGVVERLQFYLKLLVFKIDLKMATTASFFADSAHLPMVMDIPLEPSERLHAGSGMLFNWLPKDARFLPHARGTTTLLADAQKVAAGPAALATDGLRACHGSGATCTYSIEGTVGTGPAARSFFIDMVVPRTLVEKGFYPLYVENLAAFKQAAAFDYPDDGDKGRIAMYFEVSGLPKGQHKMDYWIRLGDLASAPGSCPAPVAIKGLVGVPKGLAH